MAVTTIKSQAEVPARATAVLGDALAPRRALAELLAERNTTLDRVNAIVDVDDAVLDAASDAAIALERQIRDTPSKSVDDAVAKVALLAEFVREHGSPDEEDVLAVISDVSRIFLMASDPMTSREVDSRDAHWSLAPIDSTSPAIAALAQEVSHRYADERKAMEGDDEAVYEAAVAHTGPIAHQLMATPATTLADFRAKARAVAWALSDDWDAWTDIGTFGQFGKSLIRELLGEDPTQSALSHHPIEAPTLLAAE